MEPGVPRGQGRQTGLTQTAKSLLKNVIRHTDTHNRLKEEGETWQHFYKMRGMAPPDEDLIDQDDGKARSRRSRSRDDLTHKRVRRKDDARDGIKGDREGVGGDLDVQRSFLYDDRVDMSEGRLRRGSRHAHMDDSVGGGDRSTYWMRQLHRVEEADPDRWGHSGFKELYPKDYDSGRSHSSSSSTENDRRKKKRRRGDISERRKKRKEKKKKRKKKRKHSSIEESSDEEDEVMHRKKKRRKKDKDSNRDERKIKKFKTIKKERESTPSSDKDRLGQDRKNGEESSDGEETDQERRTWRRGGEDGGNRHLGSSRESSHRKKKRRR